MGDTTCQAFLRRAYGLDRKDGLDGELSISKDAVQSRYILIGDEFIVDFYDAKPKAIYRSFYSSNQPTDGAEFDLEKALAAKTDQCLNVGSGIYNAASFWEKVVQKHGGNTATKIALYNKLFEIDPNHVKARLKMLKTYVAENDTANISEAADALIKLLASEVLLSADDKKEALSLLLKSAEALKDQPGSRKKKILEQAKQMIGSADDIESFIKTVNRVYDNNSKERQKLLESFKQASGLTKKDYLAAANALASTDVENAHEFLKRAFPPAKDDVEKFKSAFEASFKDDEEAKAEFIKEIYHSRMLAAGLPIESTLGLDKKVNQIASLLKDRGIKQIKPQHKEVLDLMKDAKKYFGEAAVLNGAQWPDFYYYRALLALLDTKSQQTQAASDLKIAQASADKGKDPELNIRVGMLTAFLAIRVRGRVHETNDYARFLAQAETALSSKTTPSASWQGYYVARLLPHYWNILTMGEPNEIRGQIGHIQDILVKMEEEQISPRLHEFKKRALEQYIPNNNLQAMVRDFFGETFFSEQDTKLYRDLQRTLNLRTGQEAIAKTVKNSIAELAEKTQESLDDLTTTKKAADSKGKSLSAEIAESLFKQFFEQHFKKQAGNIKLLMTGLFDRAQSGDIKNFADLLSAPLSLIKANAQTWIKGDASIKELYGAIKAVFPSLLKFLEDDSSYTLLAQNPNGFLEQMQKKLTDDLKSPTFKNAVTIGLQSLPQKFMKDQPLLATILGSVMDIWNYKQPIKMEQVPLLATMFGLKIYNNFPQQDEKTKQFVNTFVKSFLIPLMKNPSKLAQQLSHIKELANLDETDKRNPITVLRVAEGLIKKASAIDPSDPKNEKELKNFGRQLVKLGLLAQGDIDDSSELKKILSEFSKSLEKLRGIVQVARGLWQTFDAFRTVIKAGNLKAALTGFKLSDFTISKDGEDIVIDSETFEVQLDLLNGLLELLGIQKIEDSKPLDDLSKDEMKSLAKSVCERVIMVMERLGMDEGDGLSSVRTSLDELKKSWTWASYGNLIKNMHTIFNTKAKILKKSSDKVFTFINYQEEKFKPDALKLSIALADLLNAGLEIGGQKIDKPLKDTLIGMRSAMQLYVQLQSARKLADIAKDMKNDFKEFTTFLGSFDFSVGNWSELKDKLKDHKERMVGHLYRMENALERIRTQINNSDLGEFIPGFSKEMDKTIRSIQRISKVLRTSFDEMEKVVDNTERGLVERMKGVAVEIQYLKLDDRQDKGDLSFNARFDLSIWRPNKYFSLEIPLRLMLGEGLLGGAELGLGCQINPFGGYENFDLNFGITPVNVYVDGETALKDDGKRRFMGGFRPRASLSGNVGVAGGLGKLGAGMAFIPSFQFRDPEHWGSEWYKGLGAFVEFQRSY